MNTYTKEELDNILTQHKKWIEDGSGKRANLEGANLEGVNLRGVDLRSANLEGANLYRANLYRAYLEAANLYRACLEGVNLEGANLEGIDLRSANLKGASLKGASLKGATTPHFRVCPEKGSFTAYKKTTKGVIEILVPEDAERTNSLVGRKCRASKVVVVGGDGIGGTGPNYPGIIYDKGAIITCDDYDDDVRVECTKGIHFFMTKREAEEW